MTRILHTPGPWDCEIYPNEPSYFQVFTGCSTIALVERWDKSDPYATAEAQANARLIAAAPDLLSAAAFIRNHCSELWEQDERYRSGIASIMDACEAAMTKAENGAS